MKDKELFSKNIAKKLDEKGFLGNLKADTFDDRVKKIIKKMMLLHYCTL